MGINHLGWAKLKCRSGPRILAKSTYALGMRNGKTFIFSGARIVGEWAYLQAEGGTSLLPNAGIDTRRGVAVRVDDIMRFH